MSHRSRNAVLLVDDDPDVLAGLGRILKLHDWEIESADTLAIALDRDDWGRFLAVVLDRRLPDGSADLALSRFRECDPEVAIIIVTGFADLEGTIVALQQQVEDYLIKPISPSVLLARLDRIAENRAARERVRRLEQEVINAVEREKQRVSIELHEEIGSKLTAIQLDCSSLRDRLEKAGQGEAALDANKMDRLLQETIREIRALSLELQPVYPDPFGLEGALKQLAGRVSKAGQARCRFSGPTDLVFEDSIGANQLFRIAQEAVNNAVRHGASSSIEIEVRETVEEIILRVVDNGIGFDTAALTEVSGLGLPTMGYRARALGGTLVVRRGAQGGTEVICRAPRRGLSVDG